MAILSPLVEPTSTTLDGPARRGALRHACQVSTTYYLLAEAQSEPRLGWIINVSTSGLALVVGHAQTTDVRLGIPLHGPDRSLSFLLTAQVVRCLPYQDGWLLGCAFDRPLSADELANLL